MMTAITLSRYRGCLFGALAGDCIGFVYEFTPMRFTDECEAKTFGQAVYDTVKNLSSRQSKQLIYTDDSAMARSLSKSLLESNGFKAEHLAKLFTETFFDDKLSIKRAYGLAVPRLFKKLRDQNYADPFGPAKEQFDGRGSYGNGAAMRVAPVALYYANDLAELIRVANLQSLITHSHPDGIMGALIIAVAVHIALHTETGSLTKNGFLEKLLESLVDAEKEIYQTADKNPYREKFSQFSKLMAEKSSSFTVAKTLGNNVSALGSVPTAVFSFVKFLEEPENLEDSLNPLTRTLAYAISLHGDTDTIATMAGAIAGAYYGDGYFPAEWGPKFEGFEDYVKFAEAFYKKTLC